MKTLLTFAFAAITSLAAEACSGTQQANSNSIMPVAVTSGIAFTNILYDGTPDSYTEQDGPEQFITKAAIADISEIQLSQLARKRAQDPAVKSFASLMIKDHTSTNKELKKLAASRNIDLPGLDISSYKPDKPGSTAGKATVAEDMDINQKMNKLMTSPGKQFDPQYVDMMVTDHQKAIGLFEQGSRSNDAEVKAFALKHLPGLKMHLKMVLALKSKIPDGAGTKPAN